MKRHTIFLIILGAFITATAIRILEEGTFNDSIVTNAEATRIETEAGSQNAITEDRKININTDEVFALVTLDGIGPEYAERIIKYRRESGNFEVIQDIMKVPGISEKRFLKIKDKISVE